VAVPAPVAPLHLAKNHILKGSKALPVSVHHRGKFPNHKQRVGGVVISEKGGGYFGKGGWLFRKRGVVISEKHFLKAV